MEGSHGCERGLKMWWCRDADFQHAMRVHMVRAHQVVQTISRHKGTFLRVEVAVSKSESIAKHPVSRRVYLRWLILAHDILHLSILIKHEDFIVSNKKIDGKISKKTTGLDSSLQSPEDVFFFHYRLKRHFSRYRPKTVL